MTYEETKKFNNIWHTMSPKERDNFNKLLKICFDSIANNPEEGKDFELLGSIYNVYVELLETEK